MFEKLKYGRLALKYAGVIQQLTSYIRKSCKFCSFELKSDYEVSDFIMHILNNHSAELNENETKALQKFLERLE